MRNALWMHQFVSFGTARFDFGNLSLLCRSQVFNVLRLGCGSLLLGAFYRGLY